MELWKYAVAGIGMAGMAVSTSSMTRTLTARSDLDRPLPEVLADAAAGLNAKRGQSVNGMIIDRAFVKSNTIHIDIVIPNAPRQFSRSDATVRARQNMIAMYCNKTFEPLLRRGVSIVHNFQTKGGRDLVDSRLDVTMCKRSA